MKVTVTIGKAKTDAFYIYENVDVLPYDDDVWPESDTDMKIPFDTDKGKMMIFVEMKDGMDMTRVQIKP